MKGLYALIFGFCLTLFISCDKDSADPDGNLEGTWDVEKVEGQQYTNGNPGILLVDNNPTGYIEFNSNGNGEQNYTFTVLGTAYPNTGSFQYTATDSEIIIKRFNQADLVWTRVVNTASQQVASYDIAVNATTFVRYTLTLEK